MPKNKENPMNSNEIKQDPNEAILKELILIRRLIVFLVAKLGSDSGEIGVALGIPPRTLRDWVSFSAIVRSNEKADNKESKGKKGTKRISKETKTEEDKGTELTTEELNKE